MRWTFTMLAIGTFIGAGLGAVLDDVVLACLLAGVLGLPLGAWGSYLDRQGMKR
jgi:hypothetical protein